MTTSICVFIPFISLQAKPVLPRSPTFTRVYALNIKVVTNDESLTLLFAKGRVEVIVMKLLQVEGGPLRLSQNVMIQSLVRRYGFHELTSEDGDSCNGLSCGLLDCAFSSDSRLCSHAASARLSKPFDRPGDGYE